MMYWVWIVLIGFATGLVARWVTAGSGPRGLLMAVVLGIAGSVLASFIGLAIGWYAAGQMEGFIASVVGAIVLLLGYHLVTGSRH